MDYQYLVKEIIDAEQSAQELARETRERQPAQEETLQAEAASVHEAMMARARVKVEAARREINTGAAAELERWDRRLAAAMEQVETADEKHRKDWVETLFRVIVEDTQ